MSACSNTEKSSSADVTAPYRRTRVLEIILRIQSGNQETLDERSTYLLLSPSFQDPHLSESIPDAFLPQEKQTISSPLSGYLQILIGTSHPSWQPPIMSTWLFSSRTKKLFLANVNAHSSKCFAGLPSTLQKVSTELFLLCLYCPIGFLNMNVYVSSPQTHYKLREDKESILTLLPRHPLLQ